MPVMFVFLVKIDFHYVGQAGLKLLTSGDPPTSGSQSAGITDVRPRARPRFAFQVKLWLLRENRLVWAGGLRRLLPAIAQAGDSGGREETLRKENLRT